MDDKDDELLNEVFKALDKVADWAIQNTKPDEDSSIEAKTAYEIMKYQRNNRKMEELYIKAQELSMMCPSLCESLYDIVKQTNEKTDIMIKQLENQVDGEE